MNQSVRDKLAAVMQAHRESLEQAAYVTPVTLEQADNLTLVSRVTFAALIADEKESGADTTDLETLVRAAWDLGNAIGYLRTRFGDDLSVRAFATDLERLVDEY